MGIDKNDIRNWVIYKITSPSGRVYIGKTCNYKQRIWQYKHSAKGQKLLKNSFQKYGFDAHLFEIVEAFNRELSYVNEREIFWIKEFKSNSVKYPEMRGMNLTDGGEGTMGHKFTPEQLKRLSDSHIGQLNWRKGKPMSQEYKDRISKTIKGTKYPVDRKRRTFSVEQRKAVSEFHKGNTFRKGKKLTEEQKERMRIIHINKFGKPVLQYNKDGVIIAEYISLSDASNKTGIPKRHICANIKVKHQKKYFFRYKHKNSFTNFTFQRRVFKRQEIKVA